MLKIYHSPGTRSVRPLWLCYEIGLKIEIAQVAFTPENLSSSEWRSISPAGKVPAMQDGDLTLFESGAIVEHILDRYGEGRLRPQSGSAERSKYLQWCWFSEATLTRPLGLHRLLKTDQASVDALAQDALVKAHSSLGAVEQALSEGPYLLGSVFTAVDIMMGYSLFLASYSKVLDSGYPLCQAYLGRLQQRPGYRWAMQAGAEK